MPEKRTETLEELDREAYDWVVRFVGGRARAEDVSALRQWAARSPDHAAAFDRASLLWQAAGPAGRELLAEDVPEQNGSRRRLAVSEGRSVGRRAVLGGALAASAAGVAAMVARPPLGLWPSWSELGADFRTDPGAQRRIALSDHVAIELNTRTSLAVRSTSVQADHVELIAGEAAVALDPVLAKPFVITAADGRAIGMAGARFDVRYDELGVCVTCVAGNIRVEQQAAVQELSAGQQVRYGDQGIVAAVPVDLAIVTAWQQGIVIFQSTPVAQVMAEVNRYRPGRVILTNAALGRRLFNARLPIAKIGRVVYQVAEIFGAHVTALPGGIVLLG